MMWKEKKRIGNKERARYRRIRDLGGEDEEREVDLRKVILNSPRWGFMCSELCAQMPS